jgi:hypothetical protein
MGRAVSPEMRKRRGRDICDCRRLQRCAMRRARASAHRPSRDPRTRHVRKGYPGTLGELDAPAPCRNDLSKSKRAWSGIEQSERCVLRRPVEYAKARNAVPPGDEDLVQVALAPFEPASHLESDETDLEALPASHPERRSSTRHVANLLLEEPDAWKSASPDLWGPRVW